MVMKDWQTRKLGNVLLVDNQGVVYLEWGIDRGPVHSTQRHTRVKATLLRAPQLQQNHMIGSTPKRRWRR